MLPSHPAAIQLANQITQKIIEIDNKKALQETDIKLVFGKKLQEIANELANETL